MYKYKWKPSKTKAKEFAKTMQEIDSFCQENGISQSLSSDSYYFTINGKNKHDDAPDSLAMASDMAFRPIQSAGTFKRFI